MMKWRRLGLLVLLCVFMYGPSLVFAAAGPPGQIVPEICNKDPRKCGCAELVQLAQNILNTGIYIAVVLSAILFAWAGFKYLNAGSSGAQTEAKTLLWNVTIGLVLILVAWGIVDTIIKTIAPGSGGAGWIWNQLQC